MAFASSEVVLTSWGQKVIPLGTFPSPTEEFGGSRKMALKTLSQAAVVSVTSVAPIYRKASGGLMAVQCVTSKVSDFSSQLRTGALGAESQDLVRCPLAFSLPITKSCLHWGLKMISLDVPLARTGSGI